MNKTAQNKNLTKLSSNRVELIYFNNRVVKVPVISVALSDGRKPNAGCVLQKTEPSKMQLQELGLELNIPSYSSQFQKKMGGSSTEPSPVEIVVDQEALEKLKQNETNHIKVKLHNSSKSKTSTTPAAKKTTSTPKTSLLKKALPITPKATASNQRRSKSAPPKNTKLSKPKSNSSNKTITVDHLLGSSKGIPVPRLLVDVTSTSHQPANKLTTMKPKAPQNSTPYEPHNQAEALDKRIPLFSISSSSSDSSDCGYTLDSIKNRINSHLKTSVESSPFVEPSEPKVQERGRSSLRTADRFQKSGSSKSTDSVISVDTLIRDTKEVMLKEKSQRDRIKEDLSAVPVLNKKEEEDFQPEFRTPQVPASKVDIQVSSRMREIKQMVQSEQTFTSDSETEEEQTQQKMQALLQRIRKPSVSAERSLFDQHTPSNKWNKNKIDKEEGGLTDREERLKEKLVDEKASSLQKLQNELEIKELEIFKLQEETLDEIEKQKERLRKKELKLRKFQEKMNVLSSDYDDGTSSASKWSSSKPFLGNAQVLAKGNDPYQAVVKPKTIYFQTSEEIQNEEEHIKNEIDKRILELRKLLESKRLQKEVQQNSCLH